MANRLPWTAILAALVGGVLSEPYRSSYVAILAELEKGVVAGLEGKRLAVRRTLIALGGEIRESAPKTRRGLRQIAIDKDTVAALREWRRAQLRERLGHATVAITMDTYTHAIPALQEEAAELNAGLVAGRLGTAVPWHP